MMCPQRLKRHVFVVLKRDGGSFCSWPIWPCQSGLAITQLRLVTLGHLPDYSTPIATVGLLIYCCWHSCELRLITKTIKCEMCNFMLQTMYYARCARGCNSSPEASIHQSTLETHMITQSCSSIFLCELQPRSIFGPKTQSIVVIICRELKIWLLLILSWKMYANTAVSSQSGYFFFFLEASLLLPVFDMKLICLTWHTVKYNTLTNLPLGNNREYNSWQQEFYSLQLLSRVYYAL